MASESMPYVSRGGLKLAAALDAFDIDPTGLMCADLGASTGGFTDCLLQRGAANVYAVDTAYGQLAWTLRQDSRVVVLERTNVLHFDPSTLDAFAGCALVTIDLGWTRQAQAVPAALRWLDASPDARLVTLIKPHYEVDWPGASRGPRKGVLDDEQAERVAADVLACASEWGVRVLGQIRSPIRGGGSRKGQGNVEYVACLAKE